ncbi:uncharacterized protein GIQ15_06282 [Arthroderma uncinatum]|uniref:uncharacterized protein n=1 Tax=Arthroderma uncinatum TaxID=74035 RepID=UPI00144AC044|nr:uncharacterized protein GIQ15_06282 [Arthroderma uncinatum]KAF3480935.1 hypothetical protein GIQ15_06282 [Arthroderma uncinatum]
MPEPIAVIGSACRFPGGCDTPSKLWDLLKEPHDICKEVPPSRFNVNAFYHPEATHHGTTNATKSYFLEEDVSQFDSAFFNIRPVESDVIDPQQRILMETVYDSLCAAGLPMERLRGSPTAVYVGMMCDDWSSMIASDMETLPTYTATGLSRSIVANRISYFFDWHGPSMTIDTACSSSLVAVHQAVQVLRSGESSVAIATGTNLILSPVPYVTESNLRMLSPTGRSAMWDAAADGYTRGEGVASIVLKTLSQALADGDSIECLIRETGVNQDGRTAGLTMPNNSAQAALILNTYRRAGLDITNPDDRPQYFHAHGTGTPAGDPQEAEAISTALFPDGYDVKNGEKLLVGSIKTIIGHTESSAGLASLISTSLAMKNGTIPPNLHFNQLSEKIAPFYTHLCIPTSALPWPTVAPGQAKRASINSFGFGGTNAHAIIESYEATPKSTTKPKAVRLFTPLTFSAASETALQRTIGLYADYLKANPAVDIQDLAWTLQSRRSTLPYRLASVAGTAEELSKQLGSLAASPPEETELGIRYAVVTQPSILGVFTGQGAQWPRMGAHLINSSTWVQERISQLDSVLQSLPAEDRPSWTIKKLLLAGPEISRVTDAAVSQPLCLAVQIILVDILRTSGIRFKAVVGHSSGEIGAAYAAGFLSDKDAIRVAYYRGIHTKLACSPNKDVRGSMMAVGLSYDEAVEFCQHATFHGRIQIAAVNSTSSITLSGDEDAIDEALEIFNSNNKFARKLKVDTAYHSAHMAPCAGPYLKSMKAFTVEKNTGTGPMWFSSVSGQQILNGTLTESYWVDNMCKMVLFSSAITQAVSDAGPFDMVIEVGPHPALKGPTTAILEEIGQKPPYTGVLSRNGHDVDCLSTALGLIWKHMGPDSVDFDCVERLLSTIEEPRVSLSNLPAYPFDRQRSYWTGSRISNQHKHRQTPPNPLLGILCSAATTSREFQWRNILQNSEISWLTGHRLQGQVVFPATGYVAMAVEAMGFLAAQSEVSCFKISDLDIRRAISFNEEGSSVEVIVNVTSVKITDEDITAEFTCHSILPDDVTAILSASARLTAQLGCPTADILPCYTSDPFNLVEVNKDEFYRNLTKLGHDYSHPFRGVSHIKRKPDYSTGLIEDQSGHKWEDDLLFHPGMLDTGLQTTLAAWSFPGDGQIWSLHVPTFISSITLNPYFSPLFSGKQRSMKYESFLRTVAPSNVIADVHLYTEDGSKAIVQFEGVSIVPFSPASAADDVPLFSNFQYKLASPDGQLAAMGEMMSSSDIQLYMDTERISYWYIRNIISAITPIQREHVLPHFKFYLRWCEHMVDMVTRGAYPRVSPERNSDTRDDIANLIGRYKSRKDIRFVEIVGDHLVKVILEGTSMLEYMNQDGLMLAVYEDGLAAGPNNRWLGRIMAQIAHRYPRMHILEIGAGTGASAGPILAQLGPSFSTYTFTDVSSGFFPEAKERFKDYSQRMIYKPFNIEQLPSVQGFEEGHYDTVVAANVLHVSADITQSMRNVRRLLKSGGYLIGIEVTTTDILVSGMTMGTLPGWWIGAEAGRPWGPSLTLDQWDSVLRSTGFSGIDTTTPDISATLPVSVFVSQAIDQKVTILRNPLEAAPGINLQNAAIIGGVTHSVYELAENIAKSISGRFKSVMVFETVQELMASELALTPGLTVLSLTDLDEPFMKNLTASKFTSLQSLFNTAGTLLWVSRGSKEYEPYSYMMVGIGRTVKNENPNINLQLFDIESVNHSTAVMLSEALIRHFLLRLWDDGTNDLLWSAEPEVIVHDGHHLIPRVLPNEEKNKRYNSHHRDILKEVNMKLDALQLVSINGLFDIQEISPLRPATHVMAQSITICTTYSLLQCLRVGSAGFLRLSYGLDLASSNPIIALSDCTTSSAVVPLRWCMQVEDLIKTYTPPSLLIFTAAHIVAEQILSMSTKQGVFIVNDADAPLKSALKAKASTKGVKIVFTSSQRYTDEHDSIYIHPNSSIHNIKRRLPPSALVFAHLSKGFESDTVRDIISECLPPSCMHLDDHNLFSNEPSITTSVAADDIPFIINQAVGSSTSEEIVNADLVQATIPLSEIAGHSAFGELGQSLCQWMVAHGAQHIVLASRTPRVDSRFIESMAQRGATVRIMTLDITCRKSLRACYKEITRTMPAITGVINGAMVLQDSVFENMSYERFCHVIEPKVKGTQLLDELFYNTALDFFVVTSSIASAIGFSGQSNYSAANTFMTSLMYQRRNRGVPGSVMAIPAVYGVGYAAQPGNFDYENFNRLGYRNVSEQAFCTLFAEAILSGQPGSPEAAELIAGVNYVPAKLDIPQAHVRDVKFCHYKVDQDKGSGSGSANGAESVRAQLETAKSREQVCTVIQDAFVANLRKILQVPESDPTNLTVALVEQGIDSLVAVMLRSWFMEEIDVDIPVLKILGGSSISDLVNHAVENIPSSMFDWATLEKEGPALSGPSPPPSKKPEMPQSTVSMALGMSTHKTISSNTPSEGSETPSFSWPESPNLEQLDTPKLDGLNQEENIVKREGAEAKVGEGAGAV